MGLSGGVDLRKGQTYKSNMLPHTSISLHSVYPDVRTQLSVGLLYVYIFSSYFLCVSAKVIGFFFKLMLQVLEKFLNHFSY